MAILAGPFLKFCGATNANWSVSILLITNADGPPSVAARSANSPDAAVQKIYSFQNNYFWTCRVTAERTAADRTVSYVCSVDGTSRIAEWVIPSTGTAPRMAYASCAGFHSPRDAQRYGARRNERWQHLLKNHRHRLTDKTRASDGERPAHLLLMGGDQVYADSIWSDRREASAFVDWNDAGQNEKTKFGSLMANQAERFYLSLYLRRWTESEPAEAFASIPSLMMWDDHDIFDGWGSFPPARHNCPVYQGIFQTAAKYFRLFQQHSNSLAAVPGLIKQPTGSDQHHSFGFNLGPVAIVAPDLRGSRTSTEILGRENLDAVLAWIDALGASEPPPKHLIVMLSLPIMYPSFALLETGLHWFPGNQDLEDDVRDHWTSPRHREERIRLIQRLLKFSDKTKCQVTVVSGDVHVGAASTITANAGNGQATTVIHQLISSAMVNAPPPAAAMFFLNQFTRHTERIDDHIIGEMRTFSNTSQTFIPRRNWLSLETDSANRIWANLHVEEQSSPFVRVISPR
jgi:hypothetical protein